MMETIHSFLEHSAKRFPGKRAALFEGEAVTFSELNRQADCIKDFLAERYGKGDRIAILLDNSIDFLRMYFGVLKAGCVAVIFGPGVSDSNLRFQVQDCTPRLLVTEKKYVAKARRAQLDVEILDVAWVTAARTAPQPPREVTEEDVSSILYTSGTSSSPKGVKLQHKNVVSASKNITAFIRNTEDDLYYNILPLSHSFGLGNMHVSFMAGGGIIIERNAINLRRIADEIAAGSVTFFAAVPTTLKLLIENYPDTLERAGGHLRIIVSNSTAMPPETTRAILERLPRTRFCYYYGLTEASRSTFICFNDHPDRLSSVGQATPNTRVQIRDGDKALPAGEPGEVCVEGRHVVQEYWNRPEASSRIRNGWLYTGDFGVLDSEGFLYLLGRKDEMINIGGEKVAPAEIEAAAKEVPGVMDAAAVGIPDELLQEAVKLYIVPEPGANPEEVRGRVVQDLKRRLESYKQPKHIEIAEEIPKTDSGKVKRMFLKRQL